MEDKFIEAFKEALEIEDHEVNMEDEFRLYDEWDSLNRLSLIAMIDEEFDVQIEDAVFEELSTVKELFEAIQNRLA